jgi:hypothetical protein
MAIIHNDNIKNNNNSIQYFIYFRAYSAAQRPIIKWARAKDNNNNNNRNNCLLAYI